MAEIFQSAVDEISLPPVLDMIAAGALLEAFLHRRGQRLTLDGGQVQRLGAQCLQVLLAARAAWAADDEALELTNCSEDLRSGLDLLGATPDSISYTKDAAA